MDMTMCVPLRFESSDEVIQAAKIARKSGADLVEIWLDAFPLGDKPEKKIAKICEKITVPILCVNKAAEEKGVFEGSEEERVEILKHAVRTGVDYVDIGIHTSPELIVDLKETIDEYGGMTRLIISYHNFQETPEIKELKNLIDSAQEHGADIVKIATLAQDDTDNDIICEALAYIEAKDLRGIGLCMGEYGLRSRTENMGSLWVYAALDEEGKTAPGQLSIQELVELSK